MIVFGISSRKRDLLTWLIRTKSFPRSVLAGLICLSGLTDESFSKNELGKRPNVLFIAVDDLRPELKAYGAEHMVTPNLDKLASQGLLFQRAYCSVATCGASRASLFTGVRPTPTRFVTAQETYANKDAPWAVAMNTHFKNHGYYTLSLGKIYHHKNDNASGWSEKPWGPNAPRFALEANREIQKANPRGPATEAADVPDAFYRDGALALEAIKRLELLAKRPNQPFFMAVGFYKPHLPFVAPQKYWDLYPLENIRLPDNYQTPENAPKAALHQFGELRNYEDMPAKGPISEDQARHLIRGYYACVSYIDAQAGKVLDALETLGLSDNTIVVVWGDHGWNLGDHLLWCKHSVFESSLRIPLIIRAPGIDGGLTTVALADSVDIYPTLCELTDLPIPDSVEGVSLVPVIKFPQRPWVRSSFSRFRTGDSIRTNRYRYSEYHSEATGEYLGRMLYDHQVDPLENVNLAERPQLAETVRNLAERLKVIQSATDPRDGAGSY